VWRLVSMGLLNSRRTNRGLAAGRSEVEIIPSFSIRWSGGRDVLVVRTCPPWHPVMPSSPCPGRSNGRGP